MSFKFFSQEDKVIIKNKKFFCRYCYSGFTRNASLSRHLKNGCKVINVGLVSEDFSSSAREFHLLKKLAEKEEQIAILTHSSTLEKLEKQIIELKDTTTKEIEQLKDTTEELKKTPRINNQILQVVCVGNNDNYLDMLTQQWGNFSKALEYIKDCALSSLIGDCKLIEKIYLSDSCEQYIQFIDKNRTKIEYFNENKERTIDSKELFGRKLANNVQKSYLKGVNYLITQNLENNMCPNKFLEDYDLQTWNQHIFELSNCQYQKKIVDNLDIKFKKK